MPADRHGLRREGQVVVGGCNFARLTLEQSARNLQDARFPVETDRPHAEKELPKMKPPGGARHS